MAQFEQYSKAGDIYLTRNTPELNKFPGYWQHVAFSCGWAVVEGQAEPGCVIFVEEGSFRRRNPEHLQLRHKRMTPALAHRACEIAESKIGEPYKGCVPVVRSILNEALGTRYPFISPNGFARCRDFIIVEHFEDFEHWVQPADWYEGRIR